MFFTKSSWPGTSTMPTWSDDGEVRRRQVEVREAQVDGDAARFFFRQAIGVGAGERLDQRALAVIDVSGGGDDVVLRVGHRQSSQRRRGAERADDAASCCGKIVRRSSLTLPRRDVADHRHRLLTQAGGEFLAPSVAWLTSIVTDGSAERGSVPPPICARAGADANAPAADRRAPRRSAQRGRAARRW